MVKNISHAIVPLSGIKYHVKWSFKGPEAWVIFLAHYFICCFRSKGFENIRPLVKTCLRFSFN
jgi:hypothetical protein